MNAAPEKSNKPAFFVDNEPYNWDSSIITGSQLRQLAGVPDGVDIYLEIPGNPDKLIVNDTEVNLDDQARPERFSTQASDANAGA